MALWSNRFEEEIELSTVEFGASLPVDKQMFAHDIAQSKAHSNMLCKQGIISEGDRDKIHSGLDEIKADIEQGKFAFNIEDEDIHMAIEKELTKRIGPAGSRLHTARSRNDQVACVTRLYIKDACLRLMQKNCELRESLLSMAQENFDLIIPGFTHLQHAQPVLFSHHMLAYFWMFNRDYVRLKHALMATDACPLGSAALAGTSFDIDRQSVADELNFASVTNNSLDAVSDRDFLLDLSYACSVSMIHLSRLCEEIILWSSSEFQYVELSDKYSTGSSIMPQKKNPDFAELIRGKSGRVIGDLVALLVTLKSLPLAYNKDMQEDKEGAFDAIKTLSDCMECASGMVATMTLKPDVIKEHLKSGFLAATDAADYLAAKGMPFREAHGVIAMLVKQCENNNCQLEDLTLEQFKQASSLFESDILDALKIESVVANRKSIGATGNESVSDQMLQAKTILGKDIEQVSTQLNKVIY